MKKTIIPAIVLMIMTVVLIGANFASQSTEKVSATINHNTQSSTERLTNDVSPSVGDRDGVAHADFDHVDENGVMHFAPIMIIGNPDADMSAYEDFSEYENADNATVIEFSDDDADEIVVSLKTLDHDIEQYRLAGLHLDD